MTFSKEKIYWIVLRVLYSFFGVIKFKTLHTIESLNWLYLIQLLNHVYPGNTYSFKSISVTLNQGFTFLSFLLTFLDGCVFSICSLPPPLLILSDFLVLFSKRYLHRFDPIISTNSRLFSLAAQQISGS